MFNQAVYGDGWESVIILNNSIDFNGLDVGIRVGQGVPGVSCGQCSGCVQEDGYYHEYCRLYLANIALTNQVKELI